MSLLKKIQREATLTSRSAAEVPAPGYWRHLLLRCAVITTIKSISAETPSLPIRTLTFSIHSKVRPTLRRSKLRWLLPAELQLMRTPKSRAALRRSGKATFPEELNSKSQSLTAVKMRPIRRKRINLKRPIPYLRLRRKINQKSI